MSGGAAGCIQVHGNTAVPAGAGQNAHLRGCSCRGQWRTALSGLTMLVAESLVHRSQPESFNFASGQHHRHAQKGHTQAGHSC